MSGTSMDGIDISYCSYLKNSDNQWEHTVIHTYEAKYTEETLQVLKFAKSLSAFDLLLLDKKLGEIYGDEINNFIKKFNISDIDAIASHGHTVYHQPDLGITNQIGCGETIAVKTGIKVINDFRKKDVLNNGQGAPLVPIGDLLLFNNLGDTLLNIGGFCNVTLLRKKIIAFDICPGNLPLNFLMNKINFEFDFNGEKAKSGKIDSSLLKALNKIEYYNQSPPKSLGTEWLDANITPLIDSNLKLEDILNTVVEHIATQISNVLNSEGSRKVLVTGGGAKNNYLIERIQSHSNAEIVRPNEELINFKEAIVFGFLGALYLNNDFNTLSDVTGATKNVIGGILHIP